MYQIDELDKLAARLELASEIADAASKSHAEHGENDQATQQQNRADSGRHYVKVCRYFAERLRERQRSKEWKPPTYGEVLAFVVSDRTLPEMSKWPHADIRGWYDHFESNGWLVSGKTKMKNWQAACRNGFRFWQKEQVKKRGVANAPKNGDPEAWGEFLKSLPRPYEQFRYAQEFLKADFSKWKTK